ncbi:MAG: glycosyltransferase [Chitinophagales bacterium]
MHILKNATALVYPSWFEGFGIPLIKAMNLGVPIITSIIIGDA